jgi:segregation and condensation protein A
MELDTYAIVQGKPITELPKDLYIPPDALKIFLEAFEGPLDLLLYLIKKQNLNILDIPIAKITEQYMQYVELMKDLHLELAAEYLVMASMLAEIKSRILLPKPSETEGDEEDPRAELVRRLQEYECYKQAAEDINALPRVNREIFIAKAEFSSNENKPVPEVNVQDLWFALKNVLERAEMFAHHYVEREILSTREKMAQILVKLQIDKFTNFEDLFTIEEGRVGVIVTFTAILELLRQTVIEMVQAEPFGQIHVRKVG